MNFPMLHTGSSTRTELASPDDRFSCFQVVQGFDASLTPSGLPTPKWFVAVNPYGFDDAETDEFDLGECFNYDPDGRVVKITGATLAQAQNTLLAQAKADADDHVQCDNGGLYAIWEMPDGLVLGGFDNGGSDTAQLAITQAIQALDATILVTGAGYHLRVENLRDSATNDELCGEETGVLQIAEELVAMVVRLELDGGTPESLGQGNGPRL